MQILRTPEDRFEGLEDWSFKPNYAKITDADGDQLRLAYYDEGPRDGRTVLLMHGEPSWSYLYRKIIPLLVANGRRVIAPDLIGFGMSDKPASRADYTYERHVAWMSQWLTSLDLGDGSALRVLRHRALYDGIARDFVVLERPGRDPVAELGVTIASALAHLARAATQADASADRDRP
jgi:hypothetical protein